MHQGLLTKVTEKTSTIFSHLAKVALMRSLTSEWSVQEKIAVFQEMLMEASNPKHPSVSEKNKYFEELKRY